MRKRIRWRLHHAAGNPLFFQKLLVYNMDLYLRILRRFKTHLVPILLVLRSALPGKEMILLPGICATVIRVKDCCFPITIMIAGF